MDLEQVRRAGRDGLLSTHEAERAGIDRRELAAAAQRGLVSRLGHGWYATAPVPDREDLHRLRAAAALLADPSRAASHHTGLVLRHLPTYRAPLATVQLVGPREPRRPAPGIRVRPRADMILETVVVAGRELACLPVATCIVQSGSTGCAESALVSADAALASGQVTREQLDAALEAAAGMRGVRDLRRVLAWADPRHESPGESRQGYSLHRLGFDYEPQVWIGGDRVDAVLDVAPVVAEFDGALKYTSPADLVAEKRREDRIRARGFEFVRSGWDDVGHLDAFERAIHAAIARSRRS